MGPFETTRDGLKEGSLSFERLDAVQLVKHAFGLRTEGDRRKKSPVLVYLYAEPAAWPDGRPVNTAQIKTHLEEINRFADLVDGAEVKFCSCSYGALLSAMRKSHSDRVQSHAETISAVFNP